MVQDFIYESEEISVIRQLSFSFMEIREELVIDHVYKKIFQEQGIQHYSLSMRDIQKKIRAKQT
jgi:hypothetical protein